MLGLVGLAIGLDTWEPGDRVDTLGAGLGIWTVVSGIIALFVGGMTTGRLAGVLTRGDGALHGVVLWSLSTILAAWLVTTSVTSLVGGATETTARQGSEALATASWWALLALGLSLGSAVGGVVIRARD